MKVPKIKGDMYRIHGKTTEGWSTWGIVVLIFGEHSVHVLADSDLGTYAHYWSHTGDNPKKFLCVLDMHYAMAKLTSGNLYEPDTDQYGAQIKLEIIESRRWNDLSKDDARKAWEDMLAIVDEHRSSSDSIHRALVEHELFEDVFGDYEGLPSATRPRPRCVQFWEHIWKPLIEQLAAELEKEKPCPA